ncbi:MAG: glycosyltransferase family 39 protein [Deferribacteres bacterium]|nr:glycosyltransferase family 39 protein [candidate division KSB1 bacterium]MCB9511780.1 glycosyltransferase family 39 protein [Deferribacteres bacterium]
MKNIKVSPEWQLIWLLAAVKLALHFLTNTNYGLQRDAFLYLALSDHLDWGFLSVPPLIAVIGKVTTSLFGDSVFAVRFFPAIVGSVSVMLIGQLVRNLGGKKWAIGLACTAFILSPAFLRSNTLFQPVSFNQFFWLLTVFLVMKMVQTQTPKYWLVIGLTCALAFLNKYSIAFLVAALLIGLLLTPHRTLLRSKYLLFGVLAGFALIAPNLYWQHQHNWPVVTHMGELQRTQLVHVNIGDFMLMQLLMNLPGLPVWGLGVLFLLFFKDGQKYRFLGFTFLAMILILLMLSGKPYYTLGIYSALFAVGGFAAEQYFIGRRRFMQPVILIFMLSIALPIMPFSLPVLSHEKMATYGRMMKPYGFGGALRWEDGRLYALPQDYADMTGWEELAQKVSVVYNNLEPAERAKTAIYAENYGQAGAIRYFGRKYGLPEPVSFSGSFLFWAPDSVDMKTLIYVNDDPGPDIYALFGSVEIVARIEDPFARESGLPVFLCRNPDPDFFTFYREKVSGRRSRFLR